MKYKARAVIATLGCFVVMILCYFYLKDLIPQGQEVQPTNGSTKHNYNSITAKYDFGKPVPVSNYVDKNYFDDAVFFGDSITYGMVGNLDLDSDNIIACKGASIRAMLEKVELSGKEEYGKVNAIGEVVLKNPKRIYIMIGINGLAWMTTQQVISDYEELIDEMVLANPEAQIYVQSIFPVSKAKENSDERYKNSKIDRINMNLLELCEEKSVYYLDTNSILKNEDGNMSAEFTNSSDGIHINKEAYDIWFNYLRNHVVK
ncbi:MAG: GDSL-type esterase/lipase family protein [Oscillospiraceae bacterium]